MGIQKGMPYQFYHGRTGDVFNVTKNAIGVEMTKILGNRQLRKRIHVRIEHVQKSRCQEEFLKRVKDNDAKRADAKAKGIKVNLKRVPVGPKKGYTAKVKKETIEVLEPLPYVEHYI